MIIIYKWGGYMSQRLLHLAVIGAIAFIPAGACSEELNSTADNTELNSLPEVKVKAKKNEDDATNYQAKSTTTGVKIEAALKDIPQTINVVTSAVIKDQGARSFEDALRNVPGVSFNNGDGGRDQVNIRGFSAIGDQFVDGLRDDALYFRDLVNLERIEVLKGPASVLYGRGSSGGIINRVTKKPFDREQAEVSTTIGTYGVKRVEGDINTPITDNVAFRITGAKEDSGGFRKEYFLDRTFVAPSIKLTPSENTDIILQLEHLDDRRLNDFGVPAVNRRPADVSSKTYYGSSKGSRDDYIQTRISAGTLTFEHRFNEDVKIRNATRYYDYDLDRNDTLATAVGTGVNPLVTRLKGSVQRQEIGLFNQTELALKTRAMGFEHNVLFGVEVAHQDKDLQRYALPTPPKVRLYNPTLTPLSRDRLKTTINNNGVSDTTAFYIQDLVTITDKWKALVGGRYDRFDQEAEDFLKSAKVSRVDQEFSPRAGLVYQPTENLSFYGAYSKSFQPSQETFTFASNTADIAPEETTNYEVGSKIDMFGGNLSTTLSVFSLERTNIKSGDPTRPGVLVPIGEQRTDGLEISTLGRIAPGLDMTAGYAFLDGEITKSPSSVRVPIGTPYSVAIEGNHPALTPRHSGNLWLTKRFGNGFGVGAGAFLMGSQYASASNAVKLPGYIRLDASAFYEQANYEVRLIVNNLLDKEYYISAHGSVDVLNTPGAPMNALLTFKIKI